MATTNLRPHLWTRNEYDRMIEAGILHPELRLELVEGEILTMSLQGSRHITAIRLVETALRNRVFREEMVPGPICSLVATGAIALSFFPRPP